MIVIRSHPPHLRARSRGLSLIELLVALLLLALMAVMGTRALDSLLAARLALTAQRDSLRDDQLVFSQIDADCAQWVHSTTLAGQATLSIAAGRLVLVRSVTQEGSATRMQVVGYQLDGGKLTRTASLATRDMAQLQVYWNVALAGQLSGPRVVLAREIGALALQTWQGSTWRSDAAAEGVPLRTRRVVRPWLAAPTGLRVLLQAAGSAAPLERMFLLGGA